MSAQRERAVRFAGLHARPGCFVIPNAFDTGSARLLAHLGAQAIASSSAGFAFTRGRPDMGVTREEKMVHLREMCAAVSVPVSADLQNGFGDSPRDAAETIRLAAEAGAVGGSIEDASGDEANPVYDIGLARERLVAAVEAARATGFPFMLAARAENYLYGRPDLADTIRRLQAFQEAGADVLFAPGLKTLEDIRAVCSSVDRPVNVIGAGLPFTLQQLEEAGVRRVSVGGALARAAYGAVEQAVQEMLDGGTFGWARGIPSTGHFNALFRD
jgi:2-methylisocitrate lyase-like PEP mutase family enzyme